MASRRMISAALLVSAGLLLLVGVFLWFENPTVSVSAQDLDERGPAGEVECTIAPYDAGLNDNRNGPGGEHTEAYVEEVGSECYSANTTRFNVALVSGVLALLMLALSFGVAVRSTRPTRST